MPSRNLVKPYLAGGYYHVYNRGIGKQAIFHDDRDYSVFLKFLRSYLVDEQLFSGRIHQNLSKEVELAAYCLMPNHYHLLLRQHSTEGMTRLLRRAMTGYVMYYNRRYGRTGPLFEANYKAVLMQTTEQLIHVSRYIHLNPQGLAGGYLGYRFSSYRYYLDGSSVPWLTYIPVRDLVGDASAYRIFVESQVQPVDRLDLSSLSSGAGL